MTSLISIQVPDILPLESLNWLIHRSYAKYDLDQCKSLINLALHLSGMPLEYPTYCLGLIQMQEGNAHDAVTQFFTCIQLNPPLAIYKKQCARCLLLLGRHDEALYYYSEALKSTPNDWELYLDQAVCYQFKSDDLLVEEHLLEAIKHTKEGIPFEKIAQLRASRGDIDGAIEVLKQALSYRSDQPDILARLGMLYLDKREEAQAFEQIGTALTYKPNHFQAILAATRVMITHEDYDVALSKYRVVLRDSPEDATLWNNIGVSYFGRGKLLSSMLCLRRAAYLNPLSWIIAANRGVLFLHTGQYLSSYQMFQTSIQLCKHQMEIKKHQKCGRSTGVQNQSPTNRGKYSMGMLHGLLALALDGLEDHQKAKQTHILACKRDSMNPVLPLNFAIELLLHNHEEALKALYECQQRMIKYGVPQIGFDNTEITNTIKMMRQMLMQEVSETNPQPGDDKSDHATYSAQ